MKRISLILLALALIGCKETGDVAESPIPALPSKVPVLLNCGLEKNKASFVVTGNNDRLFGPVTATIDSDLNTFTTNNTLSLGEVVYITYDLGSITDLCGIDIIDDYTNDYNIGDFEILASGDSTDGVNGTWTSLASMSAEDNPMIDGDSAIQLDAVNIRWLKFVMTYNGTGAFGNTPTFYISEVNFYSP